MTIKLLNSIVDCQVKGFEEHVWIHLLLISFIAAELRLFRRFTPCLMKSDMPSLKVFLNKFSLFLGGSVRTKSSKKKKTTVSSNIIVLNSNTRHVALEVRNTETCFPYI